MQQIIPTSTTSPPDLNVECAAHLWSQGHSEQPPSLPSSTHQRLWDAPDCQAKSRLLAVSCPESGAWLNALPISTLGLRLADDVVRIAVGLRLGIPLCSPHPCCCCGATVEPLGTHGLSCRFSKGRHPRHASLNDLVKRTLESAEIPSHLEPNGLYRSDGKRPDGVSIVPWKGGRILVWDVTCPDTLAPSHSSLASREAGSVVQEAEYKKTQKYSHLSPAHFFVPITVETMGVFGPEARNFFRELARRIKSVTDDHMTHQYLVQRVSVIIQRGNAAAVLGCIGEGSVV